MKKVLLLFAGLSFCMAGLQSCHEMKSKADLIIFNAHLSGFSNDTASDCIVVKAGKILAIGKDAQLRSSYWAPNTVNAKKAYVYPGFVDAHSHFTGFAVSLRYADLTSANSFNEVLDILKRYANSHPGGWLVGRGWDQNRWPSKEFPDNTQLNRLFPTRPVALYRVDGHAVLANNAAMRKSGIQGKIPPGEAIIKNNAFSGIFLEATADKIKAAIPPLSPGEMAEMLIQAGRLCHEAGLTGVTDAGVSREEIQRIDSLQTAGKLLLRIDAMLNPDDATLDYYLPKGVISKPMLRVGSVKLYADGALGSRGAYLLEPYTDAPFTHGILSVERETMKKLCRKALDAGYQVNTHAIGDYAVRLVLETYGELLESNNDKRWRIEHAQVVNKNDFGLFGKYNIIPSIQATHATSDMAWARERLGPDRVKNAYAYKRLLEQNGWLPNGTDFPVEGISPLHTFYATVFRKNLEGKPVTGFQVDDALNRTEALKSITTWAAKASFSEQLRGDLQVGMFADIVILDKDLLRAPEEEVLKARVLYTIVNGKIVYRKD